MENYKNIRDRSHRREELSSRFPDISEEEKFYKELIGEIAVWHTPQEVYEVYQLYHQQGKTIEAILSSIKFSEIRQREAIDKTKKIIEDLFNLQNQSEEERKRFDEIYKGLGRSVERVDLVVKEALKILEGGSFVFYERDGIKITEKDLEKIFHEYFRGTDLEDVSYNWREILNPEYLGDALKIYEITQKGAEVSEVIELFVGIGTKLENSLNSVKETRRKKLRRAIKENEIKIWVLSVGVNKLRGDILSDPKRVSINYKIDKGESAPILTELNHRINRQFRTNFTPIDWIPWIAIGIVALVCFGLWFASRRRIRR